MKQLLTNKVVKHIAIAAPSGGGKTTFCKLLLSTYKNLSLSVSHTTRESRGNEKNADAYFFVSVEEFKALIDSNDLIEWAIVHDNYYGTSKSQLENISKNNKIALLDIDTQGVDSIKSIYGKETISVFLLPPDEEVLAKRLRSRGTDSEEKIQKRLKNAQEEIKKAKGFDYTVTNSDIDTAFKELCHIIESEIGVES